MGLHSCACIGVAVYDNLVEAHCYGIGRTGQIVEQSRSSEPTLTTPWVLVGLCSFTSHNAHYYQYYYYYTLHITHYYWSEKKMVVDC